MKEFKFRGPKSFYFKRKRWPLYSLKGWMASCRVASPGKGGSFNGVTGDGISWHKKVDMLDSGWFRRRKIKAGQWNGPWIRIKNSDI